MPVNTTVRTRAGLYSDAALLVLNRPLSDESKALLRISDKYAEDLRRTYETLIMRVNSAGLQGEERREVLEIITEQGWMLDGHYPGMAQLQKLRLTTTSDGPVVLKSPSDKRAAAQWLMRP